MINTYFTSVVGAISFAFFFYIQRLLNFKVFYYDLLKHKTRSQRNTFNFTMHKSV